MSEPFRLEVQDVRRPADPAKPKRPRTQWSEWTDWGELLAAVEHDLPGAAQAARRRADGDATRLAEVAAARAEARGRR